MTLADALTSASQALEACSDSARLDAELLLSFVLNCSRSHLRLKLDQTLNEAQFEHYQNLINRRLQREPIAYLIGHKEFWSLPLQISPAVLVPRPETEHLVETVLRLINHPKASIVDLGTGSGAIALSLAAERPEWQIVATDISPDALLIAAANAKALHLTQVQFRCGWWTEALQQHERFDAIVSNPPYLSEDDPHLQNSEISHEPKLALVAGQQGLAAYQAISEQAKVFLKPGGLLAFEHGCDQADAVQNILHSCHFCEISTLNDLAGLPRVTVGYQG